MTIPAVRIPKLTLRLLELRLNEMILFQLTQERVSAGMVVNVWLMTHSLSVVRMFGFLIKGCNRK